MARVSLNNISKRFDSTEVLSALTLTIEDGEFLVLVGPSGCGKSTVLRLIAGLEAPTTGDILINDQSVVATPPKDRDIAMVFQNYALYPHMNVADNLAFGLKMRRVPKAEIQERVQNVAAMLGLDPLLKRKPAQLSGGQRQRVALGRAIVRSPQVFLMDEPLSNLDAKLRVETRAELMALHRRLKITTVYVTHDQTEAMTMGERLVVLNAGKIQQIGAPVEVYQRPANVFVAKFIGQLSLLKGTLHGNRVRIGENQYLPMPDALATIEQGKGHDEVLIGIRPEQAHTASSAANTLEVTCTLVEALGPEHLVHTIIDETGEALLLRAPVHELKAREGEKLRVRVDVNAASWFDPATEENLLTSQATSSASSTEPVAS